MTIVTPFGRVENKQILISHIWGMNVKWAVLTDLDTDFPPWVRVHKFFSAPGHISPTCMMNHFIQNYLEDEEQYCFLMDDDFFEDGFFTKIPNADVVIVSMLRGDHEIATADPTGCHPTFPLIAMPRNMRPYRVGLEQLIVKGKILRKYKSAPRIPGDGVMIAEIVKNEDVTYVSDAYVLFNYLQDGRWDSFNRQGGIP